MSATPQSFLKTLTDSDGGEIRITDFAPRFPLYGRTFRPPQLVQIIEPLSGVPRITIRFRPTHRYGEPAASHSSGSNHLRYWHNDVPVRLTTDAPLSYIEGEVPFALTRPIHMVFGGDDPFEGALDTTCRQFEQRTRDYWREWVRRLAVAFEWQDALIRAAITLKLSSFEETGAIVAALTTSIPEAGDPAGTGTTGSVGCATPISSCKRSIASVRRARWRNMSGTSWRLRRSRPTA